ncbi:MAG: SDR family oxidoreductase [Pseudomonadales bacterium]
MPTILISGANRGLGLALSESYVKDGWRVLAATRHTDACVADGAEQVILDLSNPESFSALAQQLQDQAIDIVWNNAGVYLDKGTSLDELHDDTWLQSFAINTLAPIRIAQALKQNLALSSRKTLVFTSSKMGSLTLNGEQAYAYRSSKSALNMAVRCLAKELEPHHISCLLLHPGHVKTDMGGPEGAIEVDESIASMRAIVDKCEPKRLAAMSNRYYDIDGSILPW